MSTLQIKKLYVPSKETITDASLEAEMAINNQIRFPDGDVDTLHVNLFRGRVKHFGVEPSRVTECSQMKACREHTCSAVKYK